MKKSLYIVIALLGFAVQSSYGQIQGECSASSSTHTMVLNPYMGNSCDTTSVNLQNAFDAGKLLEKYLCECNELIALKDKDSICDVQLSGAESTCSNVLGSVTVKVDKYFKDLDGDGYGDVNNSRKGEKLGYVLDSLDCNDKLYSIDNTVCNCGTNGVLNISTYECEYTHYQDIDGDGYGNSNISIKTTNKTESGYVSDNLDCNDQLYSADNSICNCGTGSTLNTSTYECEYTHYLDNDGDGYGDANSSKETSNKNEVGYVSDNTDCNDNLFSSDNSTCDCGSNGTLNTSTYKCDYKHYKDGDGDGFGDPNNYKVTNHESEIGYVFDNTDCDDTDDEITTQCNCQAPTSIANLPKALSVSIAGASSNSDVCGCPLNSEDYENEAQWAECNLTKNPIIKNSSKKPAYVKTEQGNNAILIKVGESLESTYDGFKHIGCGQKGKVHKVSNAYEKLGIKFYADVEITDGGIKFYADVEITDGGIKFSARREDTADVFSLLGTIDRGCIVSPDNSWSKLSDKEVK